MAFVSFNLRPDRRTLREFGLAALSGLGLLALMAFHQVGVFGAGLSGAGAGAYLPLASGLGGLAIVSALLSLSWPRTTLPIYVGLSLVGYPIGLLLAFVAVGLLFFGGFGVVVVLVRIASREAARSMGAVR